jgi:integral membrane protein
VRAALLRYRVLAYVVGTALLALVLLAMPLKYLADDERVISVVGPLHGFLYLVYLAVAFDLAYRNRWSIRETLLLLLAGTVPFLTFVAERRVTKRLQATAGSPAVSRVPAHDHGTSSGYSSHDPP